MTIRILRLFALWLVAGLCLAACTPPEPEAKVEFHMTLSVQELMAHVIDPAAQGVWSRAGWFIDESGESSLFPAIEAEWAAAENAAAMVVEGGNMLLLPGRVRVLPEGDNGDWTTFAGILSQRALAVKAATEARDTQAMFDTGGELYQACVACHEKYYAPFLQD
jgi:hypothetical protein